MMDAGSDKIRVFNQRICVKCQKHFTPNAANTKVCDVCRTHTCMRCGSQFVAKIGTAPRKFCSRKCINTLRAESASLARREKVYTCEWCKCQYVRLKKRQETRFCSPKCFTESRWSQYKPIPKPEPKRAPKPTRQEKAKASKPEKVKPIKKTKEAAYHACAKCGVILAGVRNPLLCASCHNTSCYHCKKQFLASASRILRSEKLFCSVVCREAFVAVPKVVCFCCRKVFKPKQRKSDSKYCSNECKLIAWKMGLKKRVRFCRHYGPNWNQQRKLALERDKVCQRCGRDPRGSRAGLHVHHIIPFRVFGLNNFEKANDLSNLVCLCPKCHREVEADDIPIQPNLFTGKVSW